MTDILMRDAVKTFVHVAHTWRSGIPYVLVSLLHDQVSGVVQRILSLSFRPAGGG